MKKILFVLLAVLLTSSLAFADWQDTFLKDYNESGLNVAVTNSLALGITPEEIIKVAMAIDGMSGAMLATAMCDGGVSAQALQGSLDILGINQQTVMKSCGGGQGDIAATGAFPGAGYSSAGKGTSQGGTSLGSSGLPSTTVPPVIGGPAPRPSTSGNRF